MCFSGCSVLGAMTTPAQRDRPDSRRGRLLERLGDAAADGGAARLDALALLLGDVADLEQAVDEQPQPRVGRQAARRGVRRVEQAEHPAGRP